MTVFTLAIAMLAANLAAGSLHGSSTPAAQNVQGPATCEQAVAALAKFTKTSSESGATPQGDPYTSSRRIAADGEWFAEGTTIYKSASRFNKSVRHLTGDATTVTSRTPLSDTNGHRIGQRVMKEVRVDGKVSRVQIWIITDRMIKGIDALSLTLALTVEKATMLCGRAQD